MRGFPPSSERMRIDRHRRSWAAVGIGVHLAKRGFYVCYSKERRCLDNYPGENMVKRAWSEQAETTHRQAWEAQSRNGGAPPDVPEVGVNVTV